MTDKDNTYILSELKRWLVQQFVKSEFSLFHAADILVKIADIESSYELSMAEIIGVDDDDEDEDEKEKNDESVSD